MFWPYSMSFVSLYRCPLSAGLFRAYLPFLAGPDFYDTICLPDGQRFFMWPSLGFNKPPSTDTQRCVVYGQRIGGVAGVYSYFGYPFPLLAMSRKHAGKLNQHLYVGHYLGTQDSL